MLHHLKNNKSLLVCLSILLISSLLGSMIQTDFGNTKILLKELKTPEGQTLVYDLYKPKSASENNQAPFIVVVPGFQRSKEALSNIAIELSRRGHVVALIDPYAQGMSSSSTSRLAATTQGYGMFALVEYAYDGNIPYVDINKIASTGHSMGGNAAIRGASYFGKQAKEQNTKSKLNSVFVSGYVLTLREEILKYIQSNVGVSYALYDEGAFRNDLKGWDSANMKIAPESLRTVNSSLPDDSQIKKVELGKYYGEIDKRTARVIFNEELLHPFQPYNREATANQISYFSNVLGFPKQINPNNQIWQFKEFFTLLNMIVSLIMLIPLTKTLLKINFFQSIVKPVPIALPKQDKKSKSIFWFIFFMSASIACVTFIPMVDIAKIFFVEQMLKFIFHQQPHLL